MYVHICITSPLDSKTLLKKYHKLMFFCEWVCVKSVNFNKSYIAIRYVSNCCFLFVNITQTQSSLAQRWL